MRYLLILTASTLLAGAACRVEAASEPASPTAASTAEAKKSGKICKRTERVGTRLGSKKICMTKDEWANAAAEARDALNEQQSRGITRSN